MITILPPEAVKRLFSENDILGLKMRQGSALRVYYLRIKSVEGPNDVRDYSLGAATAQAAAGTDWNDIKDGSARYILQPQRSGVVYQAFYGIAPGYAWVYRRYPANVDLGGLQTTRTVGDRTYRIGYVDGLRSPYNSPSPETEFFTIMGTYPSFLGYHPYTEPASITVRMNFFISLYEVDWLKNPTAEEVARARVRTMGGVTLLDAPSWLSEA